MGEVIHFKDSTDRINFIRGKHTEIKPIEVEPVKEEKPKKKRASKKKEKEDAV